MFEQQRCKISLDAVTNIYDTLGRADTDVIMHRYVAFPPSNQSLEFVAFILSSWSQVAL